jgi:calcineurin-like phosphoesterase family protein
VWVVGDVVNQNTPEWLEAVGEFNGKKILFRGNHDRVFTDEQLAPYFVRVVPEGEGLFVTVGGVKCFVTHYPTQGLTHAFNLVGHIHSAWKVQINALNVGVDVHHYRPIDLDRDVPFFYKAVTEFYDEDVWVAYHATQQSHSGSRGKPGRYFDVEGSVGGGS